MNYIIMADNHMSVFTNSIEADMHKHWMLQIFLSLDKPFNIVVNGKKIKCHFLVVDKNVEHCFSSSKELHFTMLIEPTSNLANHLKSKYIDTKKGYAAFDTLGVADIQNECNNFLKSKNKKNYKMMTNKLFNLLGVCIEKKPDYDERVLELLRLLDKCDCSEHSLQIISNKLYLSSSRMAHLFKEQTGIPLKSYIVLHKLHRAYVILLNDNKNITDAAMLAGFDSPSHLAYTNKSMTGMTLTATLKDSEFLKVLNYMRV